MVRGIAEQIVALEQDCFCEDSQRDQAATLVENRVTRRARQPSSRERAQCRASRSPLRTLPTSETILWRAHAQFKLGANYEPKRPAVYPASRDQYKYSQPNHQSPSNSKTNKKAWKHSFAKPITSTLTLLNRLTSTDQDAEPYSYSPTHFPAHDSQPHVATAQEESQVLGHGQCIVGCCSVLCSFHNGPEDDQLRTPARKGQCFADEGRSEIRAFPETLNTVDVMVSIIP